MKKGFTLAEVLITLGIIGVIAALTIPNLVGNYNAKIATTQLKRVYNQAKNALAQASLDGGLGTKFSKSKYYSDNQAFFDKYFEFGGNCTRYTGWDHCLNYTIYSPDGSKSVTPATIIGSDLGSVNDTVCVVTTAGSTICKRNNMFLTDINGKKEPNRIGQDVFWFGYSDEGKMYFTPLGANNTASENTSGYERIGSTAFDRYERGDYCKGNVTSAKSTGCLMYVMSNGWKMD